MQYTRALAILTVVATGSVAFAVDQPITGKITVVKPAKLAKFVSKSKAIAPAVFPLPAPGGASDPTLTGAQLTMFDTTGVAGSFVHSLPASGWKGLGNPAGSKGYKYIGKNAGDTICKVALLKEKVIKATCKGAAVSLDPPFAGTEGVILGIPSGTVGAAMRYCAEFGGTEKKNDDKVMKRKDALAPMGCPVLSPISTPTGTPTGTAAATLTPTAPPAGTSTATSTMTATPLVNLSTPTATPSPTVTSAVNFHTCVLATAPSTASQIQIHIEALPVPLTYGLSGGLEIGANGSVADCKIQNINPVNIASIGYVCITPGPPCDLGARHCGPLSGPPLGVDVQSDGNTGACSGNAQCATICDAHCGTDVVLTSACTGYCSEGAMMACTDDDTCANAGQGSCNGPDPVGSNGNICQCTCVDSAAHGASDAGDLQCNLGATILVENGAPCDGNDVRIVVGDTCLPVTTQRATSLITQANFDQCGSPPCYVPVPPNVNDQFGLPIPCTTLDASTTTGLVGVGAVNFFGSALGDLAIGLKTTCQ